MTTTTETQTAKPKTTPNLYVFVDAGKEPQGGKPAGRRLRVAFRI
jgi:hypothetical protein